MAGEQSLAETEQGRNCTNSGEGDREKTLDETVLREGIFTVYYPTCKPLVCEVFLTPTELILEEYDESEYDCDYDMLQERYPIEDVFGFHVVRNGAAEELPVAYVCVVLYTKAVDGNGCRKRVLRVLEINQSHSSYDENLEVAKEWALDIQKLLSQKFPLKVSSNQYSKTSHEKQIEDIFKDLGPNGATNGSTKDSINDGNSCDSEIVFELCSELFTLAKSILFLRKFVVIINPISGQGKSGTIFQDQISTVFRDCGIQSNVLHTERTGHALTFLSKADLTDIDGIIAVGGDGLVNEIVNGIRCRDDFHKISDIPIGVIATGSGNGLARSIAEYCGESHEYRANPVLSSALAVARGCVASVNLTEVRLDERVFYSFLSVGWGLLSDIDIESEVLRAIGEFRFIIWSFIRLANLRRYGAELSYIPHDGGSGSISSRVTVKDEFVSVYSACQSHIGSDMMFSPEAKLHDGVIHLTYLPSETGRFAAARFLAGIQGGHGHHLHARPVQYVKVKEFTIRSKGGIQGTLTVDGEQVTGEEITVKLCDTPLSVFCKE